MAQNFLMQLTISQRGVLRTLLAPSIANAPAHVNTTQPTTETQSNTSASVLVIRNCRKASQLATRGNTCEGRQAPRPTL